MFLVRMIKMAIQSRLSRAMLLLSLFIAQLMTTVVPAVVPAKLHGEELGCLAMNIYQEGRSEPVKGRLAIAAVTMNRVASRHYPDSICEVVWQAKQFSWTDLKVKYHSIKDAEAWQESLELADLFMHGAVWNGIGNAKHYHTKKVTPKWSQSEQAIASIGNHLFYKL